MINLDKHLGDFGPGNFGHASGSYMREIITYARHNKHLELNLLRLMITLAWRHEGKPILVSVYIYSNYHSVVLSTAPLALFHIPLILHVFELSDHEAQGERPRSSIVIL